MKTFLIVIVCVLAFDIFGKGVVLWKHDFIRKPSHVVFDMLITLSLFGWGMWVLGANGST